MTAPIPRPPGPWRAIARDGRLNPEEAAARAEVVAAHEAAAEEPAPVQPVVEDAPLALSPQQRIIPYEEMTLRAGGWRTYVTHDDERARLEGFHTSGAAVMVTAARGRPVRAYVLPATQKNTPRWRAIHRADLAAFLFHRRVVDPHFLGSRCKCEKRRYPTEAWAKAALVTITIRRVVRDHGVQSERRAYRCPDDDRAWHLTHIPKWYGDKTPHITRRRP
ncbi:hypothetical protein ACF1BS_04285 [Streptomyces sp. NPDC014748]|uniref:hypothetical protein n=1 Tax=Streptomyces sp. NPDC014748 TaxID=3364905 RepID=UPI0037008232